MRYHLAAICIYRYIRRVEPTHKGRESLPPAQTGRRTARRQTATKNKQLNDSRAERKDGRHQTNRKQTDSRAEKHQNKQPERANRIKSAGSKQAGRSRSGSTPPASTRTKSRQEKNCRLMEEKGKKKLQLDYYQTAQTNSRKQTEHQDGANQRPNSRKQSQKHQDRANSWKATESKAEQGLKPD